jgi:hypothetical protein
MSRTVVLVLLSSLLIVGLEALAQAAPGASIVAEVRNALRHSQPREAFAVAWRAAVAGQLDATAAAAISHALLDAGHPTEALHVAARVLATVASTDSAPVRNLRARVEARLSAGYPEWLAPEVAEHLPGQRSTFETPVLDASVRRNEPDRVLLLERAVYLTPSPPERANDALAGEFPRALYVYLFDPAAGRFSRRATVHAQSERVSDYMLPVGALLGRLMVLHGAYLGSAPDARETHAWLYEAGQPGAAHLGEHLFFYGLRTPPGPSEWVREVCHEYGHLALPPFGPFESPEPWGNGRAGELLFSEWLHRNRLPAWSPSVDRSALVERLVYPPLRDVIARGPEAGGRRSLGAEGMSFVAALVLTIERRHGAAALRAVLARADGGYSAAGLLRAYSRWCDGQSSLVQRSGGLAARPEPLPPSGTGEAAVYIPPGEWRITIGPEWSLTLDGAPAPSALRLEVGEWRRLGWRNISSNSHPPPAIRLTRAR